MNYSHDDVEKITRIAAKHAVLYGPDAIIVEGLNRYLDWLVHFALNQFWDEEMTATSSTVPITLNGKEVQVTPGMELSFQQIAELAGVENADTCVFRRKRALAQNGSITRFGRLKMQGGMVVNIANTGSV